jgi:hypothetical protein
MQESAVTKITVFHPQLAVNQGHTDFSGPDLGYILVDGGYLRIMKWETATERGEATFAPGQWLYVCRSVEK